MLNGNPLLYYKHLLKTTINIQGPTTRGWKRYSFHFYFTSVNGFHKSSHFALTYILICKPILHHLVITVDATPHKQHFNVSVGVFSCFLNS